LRVAVLGGVTSTELLVRKLFEHGFKDVHVFGYVPADSSLVSGWVDLNLVSRESGYGYSEFKKVGACEAEIEKYAPDILFAVGLSQIIPASILSITKLANVGFHPTALPRGRGRAALAWLVLENEDGAATFFEMGEDVDDGPIYVQEPYEVSDGDEAGTIAVKLLQAEAHALDSWLPLIKKGKLVAIDQDRSKATWYGKRGPEDGCIDWAVPNRDLCRLIRAAAPPHPGAFTFSGDHVIKVLVAEVSSRPELGVVGRILKTFDDGAFEVQAGEGLLKVLLWEAEGGWRPKVGALLGYYDQLEIYRLRGLVEVMSHRLELLENAMINKTNPPST
jgi:methionyl-tRNA formyltransferase